MEKALASLPDKCRLAFLLYKMRGQKRGDRVDPANIDQYGEKIRSTCSVRHCYQQRA